MTDTTPKGIRLEETEELTEAVQELAAELSLSFCEVTGFGELEWVELKEGRENTTLLKGPLQLLDLKGRLRLTGGVRLTDFVCTVSRNTDNGIQVLGGKLSRARATFLELTFLPLVALNDNVPVKDAPRKLVSDSSLPRPAAPPSPPKEDPIETKPTMPDLGPKWGKAIAESKRVQLQAEERENWTERPNRGDIVNHMQFGKCNVIRVGDEHITLRKPDRRNVQLGLSILEFSKEGEEDKHTVFSVRVKPKR